MNHRIVFPCAFILILLGSSIQVRAISNIITGDLNRDGNVNLQDLVLLANAYGSSSGNPRWNVNADLDGNGMINENDVMIFDLHYGEGLPVIINVSANIDWDLLYANTPIIDQSPVMISALTLHADHCVLSYRFQYGGDFVTRGNISDWTNETMINKGNYSAIMDCTQIAYGTFVQWKVTAYDSLGHFNVSRTVEFFITDLDAGGE